jgi:hypothetical protein
METIIEKRACRKDFRSLYMLEDIKNNSISIKFMETDTFYSQLKQACESFMIEGSFLENQIPILVKERILNGKMFQRADKAALIKVRHYTKY